MSVKELVRTHYRRVDAGQTPVDWDALVTGLESETEVAPGRRRLLRRGPLVFAAALLVVVLLGVIPLLVLTGDESPPATDDAPTPTTIVIPSTLVPTTLGPADLTGDIRVEWLSVERPEKMSITRPAYQGFGNRVNGEWVVIDGGLEFAVTDADEVFEDIDGDLQTLLWRSVDGVEWTSTVLEGLDNTGVVHLAFVDTSYFMTVDTGGSQLRYYRSADLTNWEPIDPDLTSNGLDLLVWSWTDDLIMQGTHAVFSHNLTGVTEIDPFGSDKTVASWPLVVATSDRFYTIVGQANGDGDTGAPWEVWSTSDGLDWRQDLVLDRGERPELAATRDQVMVTSDGVTPLYIADSGGPFIEKPKPIDGAIWLTASDGYFAVVAGSRPETVSASIYLSPDGEIWSQVLDDPQPAFVWAYPDRMVVGYSSQQDNGAGSGWWVSDGWLVGKIEN